MLSKAWDVKPEERPTANEFLEKIRALSKEYEANKEAWDKLISPTPYSMKGEAADTEPERPAGFFD